MRGDPEHGAQMDIIARKVTADPVRPAEEDLGIFIDQMPHNLHFSHVFDPFF